MKHFSGNSYIWINENSYNISFEILPEKILKYSINSSVSTDVAQLSLDIAQFTILSRNDSHCTAIGNIALPLAQGNYSSQNNS